MIFVFLCLAYFTKKKKIQMNLFTKQKSTHRHRKQIYGERVGEG